MARNKTTSLELWLKLQLTTTCSTIQRRLSCTMSGFLPGVRTRLCTSAFKTLRHVYRPLNSTAQLSKAEYYSSRQDLEPTNEPEGSARKNVPNVSKTNELAVDSIGAFDKPLQESQEEGEKKRQLQSPNRKNVWSRSQMPREMAMTGPRFEQTIMEYQVSCSCGGVALTRN